MTLTVILSNDFKLNSYKFSNYIFYCFAHCDTIAFLLYGNFFNKLIENIMPPYNEKKGNK